PRKYQASAARLGSMNGFHASGPPSVPIHTPRRPMRASSRGPDPRRSSTPTPGVAREPAAGLSLAAAGAPGASPPQEAQPRSNRSNADRFMTRPETSKQRASQDQAGESEIDDEAGDVHQRRDEGRRGARRVESQSAQEERQRRADEGPPQDHSDQAQRYGDGDQPAVRAVGMECGLPDRDPRETEDRQDGSQA